MGYWRKQASLAVVCGRPCSTAPVLGAGGRWARQAGTGFGGSQREQAEHMGLGVGTRKHHPCEIRAVSLTAALTACSFRTRKSQQTAGGATNAPRQTRHPGADRQHSPADTQLIRGFSDPKRPPPKREGTESAACGVPPTTFTPRRVWGLGRGMERGRAHCERLIRHASTLFRELTFGRKGNTAAAVWPAQRRGWGREPNRGRKEPPGWAGKHCFCPVHLQMQRTSLSSIHCSERMDSEDHRLQRDVLVGGQLGNQCTQE